MASEEKRFCSKCGTELRSDSHYCPKCGAATTRSSLDGSIQSWRKRRELRREARLQRRAIRRGYAPATTSPSVTTIIQKEVVKIPCKYCGALVEITGEATKCPNCGAPVRF